MEVQVSKYFKVEEAGQWCFELNERSVEDLRLPVVKLVSVLCPICNEWRDYKQWFEWTVVDWNYIQDDAIIYINIPAWVSGSGKSYSGSFKDPNKEFRAFARKKDIEILRLPYRKAKELVKGYGAIVSSAGVKTDFVINVVGAELGGVRKLMVSVCWDCAYRIIKEKASKKQGGLMLAEVNDELSKAIYNKITRRADRSYTNQVFNHSFSTPVIAVFMRQGDVFIALESSDEIHVSSPDHEMVTLPASVWIGYHPAPRHD